MQYYKTKFNPWTVGLAAAGVVSFAAVTQAEETQHQVMTALASTTLSGYVDTSAIWKFGTGNGFIPGRSFDGAAKQDGFNLDVVKVQLEKPLDESQWAAGYTVGLLFGPDANALASTSVPFGATSDFAIKNAYVSLRAPVGNGITFKVGVWDTLMGYEVFEAGNDPNFSRSYGFALEPIVHTGIEATYKVNDIVSVSAAISDRGDINTINSRPGPAKGAESIKTYHGAINLTAPDSAGWLKGATAYAVVMSSGVSAPGPKPENWINYSAGATLPTPCTGLSVGVAYDYLANSLFNASYANAVGGYVLYQATEKLKFANRTEYATGSTGSFGVFAPGAPAARNVALLGETLTADYSLWANTITRLEFRWDHSLTGQRVFNLFSTDGGSPNRNAVSLALNVIYKF